MKTLLALSLLVALTPVLACAQSLDRVEDRLDRREDIRDRAVNRGPLDRIEDRIDSAENRLDRRENRRGRRR